MGSALKIPQSYSMVTYWNWNLQKQYKEGRDNVTMNNAG
jgi:hypothetical protein